MSLENILVGVANMVSVWGRKTSMRPSSRPTRISGTPSLLRSKTFRHVTGLRCLPSCNSHTMLKTPAELTFTSPRAPLERPNTSDLIISLLAPPSISSIARAVTALGVGISTKSTDSCTTRMQLSWQARMVSKSLLRVRCAVMRSLISSLQANKAESFPSLYKL